MNETQVVVPGRSPTGLMSPTDGLEGPPDRLQYGELEAQVMDVLWDRGGWSTPAEVHEVVAAGRALAYTTTATVLRRLWRKGRLERGRGGRSSVYRPVQSREEHAAAGMSELLLKVRNRPVTLSLFVKSLEGPDRDQLRRALGAPATEADEGS